MSIVVAIKYDNGIAIASDREVTQGIYKYSNSVAKIHQYPYSKVVIGTVGRLRPLQILFTEDEIIDYKDILDNKEIDKKYCIRTIVPKLFKIMKENEIIEKREEEYLFLNTFILATSKTAFIIDRDGTVNSTIDQKHYLTIGCGEDFVKGYLDTIDFNKDKINKTMAGQIIKNAIEKSCKNVNYIDDNIDIIFLEKNS